MEKYLFLDIDGVLNCEFSFKRDGYSIPWESPYHDINARNVYCLRYFINNTSNIHIVLSSSWRKIDTRKECLNKLFELNNIQRIEGFTPDLVGKKRGEEIQLWMDCNNVHKDQIVIFDDETDMVNLKDKLIKTSFRFGGLCYRHLKEAWKLLEGENYEAKK